MAKRKTFRKLRTALALIFVFALIYATNRLDQHHFENVQHIMNSVYEDRIVAQHYIYQLNNLYHQKDEQFPDALKKEAVSDLNQQIRKYIELFSETNLTNKEAQVFQLLKKRDKELQGLETRLASAKEPDLSRYRAKIDKILDSLDSLSEIQLTEGGRLRKAAQESLDTNTFFSQLELIVLVIIGIVIQIIIFYDPKRE